MIVSWDGTRNLSFTGFCYVMNRVVFGVVVLIDCFKQTVQNQTLNINH
jgi:hypothetical protein